MVFEIRLDSLGPRVSATSFIRPSAIKAQHRFICYVQKIFLVHVGKIFTTHSSKICFPLTLQRYDNFLDFAGEKA